MKRFGIVFLSVIIMLFCLSMTACAPSMSFTGTFVRNETDRTFTMTIKSDGTFRFERKFLKSNGYDYPENNQYANVRSGKCIVHPDKKEATFTYSYYDPASEQTLKGSAIGKLIKKDGKVILSMSGEEIKGQYTKK